MPWGIEFRDAAIVAGRSIFFCFSAGSNICCPGLQDAAVGPAGLNIFVFAARRGKIAVGGCSFHFRRSIAVQ